MYDTFSLHRAALKPLLCIKGVYKYLNFSDRFSQLRDEIGNNFLSHLWWKFSGTSNISIMASAGNNYHIKLETFLGKNVWQKKQKGLLCIALLGVSNGPIQFESARKIWPLLELLVLAKFLRSIARNFVNPTL